MRWSFFAYFLCFLLVLIAGIFAIHKDRVLMVKNPPETLQQWYKPNNKRQVWLHNMFKLRREIQALRIYSGNRNADNLEKWSKRLSEHYIKIAEMVPEWADKLDIDTLSRIEQGVKNRQFTDILNDLDALEENCQSCHKDYRAVVATMYRAPDFSTISIGPSVSYKSHMLELITRINEIKIASEDGESSVALSSLQNLRNGMNTLNKSCVNCHDKPAKLYPDAIVAKALNDLQESLKTGSLKEQGIALGNLAVKACANCHSTHRLNYAMREFLTAPRNWSEYGH